MTDFRARLQQAWTEDHGQSPTWVEELLLDHYAERMDAALARYFGNVVEWEPLGFLDNPAPWLKVELDRLGVSPLRVALAAARPHNTPPTALRGPSEERTLADRVRSVHDVIRQADAPILTAAAAQLLGGFERWEPASADVEPAAMTEEQRVAHELVPLVRAAAEVPPPKRLDVLGGHLRTSRTVNDALDRHVADSWWTSYQDEHGEDEARAFTAHVDRVLDSTLIAQPPGPHPDDDLYTTVLAAYQKMLAPPLRQRQVRTEPIKLTRAQIDELPRAPRLEPFVPHTSAAVSLDGVPVVEVLTVEESTPHVEGWRLTIAQIVTGVYSAFDGAQPDYRKPLHMTQQQIERVMNLLGYERPDDWEQTLERGGEISQLLGRPVHLAYNAASSTPCIERWMDL